MNSHTSDSKARRRLIKSEFYEDDGFFSDVPTSGSLSKSVLALNKYMRKNLLYEEPGERNAEDYEDDAYFSKESSPNDSVSKCDTDSLISSGSIEKQDNVTLQIKTIKAYVSPPESPTKTIIDENNALTDDYKIKSKRMSDKSVIDEEIQNEYECTQFPSHSDKIISSSFGIVKSDNSERNENNIHRKYSQDEIVSRETPSNLIGEEFSRHTLPSIRIFTKSTADLTDVEDTQNLLKSDAKLSSSSDNIAQPKNEDIVKITQRKHSYGEVVLREKINDIKRVESNRHTLHDFSDWGNRTIKYPDVYAPLPYKSPRRYVESDVNIHYRCPVRHDPLPLVPERELARQQAEHMKRLYREQRRNKYLQELQDMQNRRHQDNFTPSQKNILPLNRYDEADRIVARALYAFNGQTARELSFRKGDLINVRRQIDTNWYEGEVHGRIGLFPYNYVEILKGDVAQSPKKPTVVEGRARAKFDFTAQTNLELPLKKGEVVVLTRRIDQNWWEGRNGNKTGIFPDSYVTVLQEPSPSRPEAQPIMTGEKPVASPAAHGLLNGSAKRSMGAHSYMPQPNNPALSNAPPATQPLPGYVAKPAQVTSTPSERGYGPPTTPGVDLNNTEPLYVDTNAEAVPYRAMYKYRPQNPDELELNEGDTVYVLEKCDDGWYVGSSQRTGRFGTFPGNYVERI